MLINFFDHALQDFLWSQYGQPDNCGPPSASGGCSWDENCGALGGGFSGGGSEAEYKMYDLGCQLSEADGYHAPAYDIYSVCQMDMNV